MPLISMRNFEIVYKADKGERVKGHCINICMEKFRSQIIHWSHIVQCLLVEITFRFDKLVKSLHVA